MLLRELQPQVTSTMDDQVHVFSKLQPHVSDLDLDILEGPLVAAFCKEWSVASTSSEGMGPRHCSIAGRSCSA